MRERGRGREVLSRLVLGSEVGPDVRVGIGVVGREGVSVPHLEIRNFMAEVALIRFVSFLSSLLYMVI